MQEEPVSACIVRTPKDYVHPHMDISIFVKICCTSYSVCKIPILAIAVINVYVCCSSR